MLGFHLLSAPLLGIDITPGVPHVFQAYSAMLDEAATALDRAGQLLSAHLAVADRVTA